MINDISTTGKYISISGSRTPYLDINRPSAGMIRMNGSTIEAYDGYSWLSITSTPMLGLTGEAETILDWAKSKMLEEHRIDELCRNNPALAKARDNYDIIRRLVASEAEIDIL